jgi:hypothetical protein
LKTRRATVVVLLTLAARASWQIKIAAAALDNEYRQLRSDACEDEISLPIRLLTACVGAARASWTAGRIIR